ncbi:hypothetical protein ACHAXR_005106 [Thalassiosira sp. AJA248-18]
MNLSTTSFFGDVSIGENSKHLEGAIEKMDLLQVAAAASDASNEAPALATKPAISTPSRPPLAPDSAGQASALNKSSNGRSDSTRANTPNNPAEDKHLTVFLRVRPPVCANDKKGNEGSINTIEVVDNKAAAIGSLPTTIRTYPPLNSNAAKVVRGGSKLAMSNSPLKRYNPSASLVDNGSSDIGIDRIDPHAVVGVKEYAYSGVFGLNATQDDVYDNVAAPLVKGLFPQSDNDGALGESALLFTLGVTNAGKTHTVMGTGFEMNGDRKDWGILPRSLDDMLSRINNMNEKATSGPKLQMYMSYLEIYNEQIFNLLPNESDAPRHPFGGKSALKLRESPCGRIFVDGLAKHAVDDIQQGVQLAQMAQNNRRTASNNINANSSRSHSICQLEITFSPGNCTKRTDLPETDGNSECDAGDKSACSKSSSGSRSAKQRKSTTIWIVDLAGSARGKKTHNHQRHLKEAAHINASLMNLMTCLRQMLNHQSKKGGATSKGKGGVVSFRDSKLSLLFKNHLTGSTASRTTMVVNVKPAAGDYDETQHVLGYATAARSVTISTVDYNRKRHMFANESNAKVSPKRVLANVGNNLSPKKSNRTIQLNPAAKQLQSSSTKFAPSKATTSAQTSSKELEQHSKELEQLREENSSLKVTMNDLRQQLAECCEEANTCMDEQLKEAMLKSQVQLEEVQRNKAEFMERINECEEEMKRQRDDHSVEVEHLRAKLLRLDKKHQAEMENLKNVSNDEFRAEQEGGNNDVDGGNDTVDDKEEEAGGGLQKTIGSTVASRMAMLMVIMMTMTMKMNMGICYSVRTS